MVRRGVVRLAAFAAVPSALLAALAAALLLVPATTALATRGGAAAGSARSPALTRAELEAGADHACIVPGSGTPDVDWSALRNPILSYPDAGAKDEALIWAGGRWHMLFSYMTHDRSLPGGVQWNVATATSTDLVHWSAPVPWPRQAGIVGVASPDIVRSPSGEYVVTYQSNPSAGGQDKLYDRTSTNLVDWSAPHPLAHQLAPHPDQRQIDGALAYTGHGLILAYKASTGSGAQHFTIAWSPSSSLEGPWQTVGQPDITLYGSTVENYELVTAAGHWQLVATSNNLDQPWIFQLDGDPATPSSWLHWSGGRELTVPTAAWDSGTGVASIDYEPDNSAFLCNLQAADGYYYLLYAGSDELAQFGGWGHAAIGIARSTNLVTWQVPPPAG